MPTEAEIKKKLADARSGKLNQHDFLAYVIDNEADVMAVCSKTERLALKALLPVMRKVIGRKTKK
jgi:hypothetical protein